MKSHEELCALLLEALVAEWRERYTVEEIWADPEKMELLDEVETVLAGGNVVISASALEFYRELFVRPTWRT